MGIPLSPHRLPHTLHLYCWCMAQQNSAWEGSLPAPKCWTLLLLASHRGKLPSCCLQVLGAAPADCGPQLLQLQGARVAPRGCGRAPAGNHLLQPRVLPGWHRHRLHLCALWGGQGKLLGFRERLWHSLRLTQWHIDLPFAPCSGARSATGVCARCWWPLCLCSGSLGPGRALLGGQRKHWVLFWRALASCWQPR